MSILTHSPAIVRDGLVLCLDAGAVRSYPGTGPQMVINGDFASDITTGWEEGEATVSHDTHSDGDGGRLKIVGSVTGRLYSSAAITTVVGQKYRFSVSVAGSSANHFVHLGETKGGSQTLQNFTLGGADGTYVWDFVADHNELWIHLGATGSSTQYYDQVSLVAIASNLSLPGDSGFSSGVSYGVPGANKWSDLSGNNNNGTLNNMQYHLDAESGAGGTRSFDFDGTSDSINLGDSNSFSFGDGSNDSPFTVAAWFYPGTLGRVNPIVSKGGYNNDVGEWHLKLEADNKMYFFLADESLASTYERAYTTAALGGGWTHIVATYNGVGGTSANTGITIYVNGDSQGLTLGGGGSYVAMENLGADLLIGKYVDSSTNYFDGKISIVHLYNRALTATEVAQNYRTHKGRFGL